MFLYLNSSPAPVLLIINRPDLTSDLPTPLTAGKAERHHMLRVARATALEQANSWMRENGGCTVRREDYWRRVRFERGIAV